MNEFIVIVSHGYRRIQTKTCNLPPKKEGRKERKEGGKGAKSRKRLKREGGMWTSAGSLRVGEKRNQEDHQGSTFCCLGLSLNHF